VPCPSHFSPSTKQQQCGDTTGICQGLGHVDCRGGSIKSPNGTYLNPFGVAFAAASYKWTKELCNSDSDGDGATNGEELGDPCCVWTKGNPLLTPPTYKLSHPGMPEDKTAEAKVSAGQCSQLQNQAQKEDDLDLEKKIASFFQPGETRANWTLRCTHHLLFCNVVVDVDVDVDSHGIAIFALWTLRIPGPLGSLASHNQLCTM
jgi:hypothetical protein